MINVRDNVTGEYSEIEHTVVPGNIINHIVSSVRTQMVFDVFVFRIFRHNIFHYPPRFKLFQNMVYMQQEYILH